MLASLSLKLFIREIRSGYLASMLLSLVLAVTIVSGISLFTDRLEKVLNSETKEFLGGDLKFESNEDSIKDVLKALNLKDSKSSEMAIFASVIFSEEEMQLSSIKAVDNSYPLIGELELQNSSGIYKTKENPTPGTLWIDERLKNLLSLKYGDEIYVGDATFVFEATIMYEPDRGSTNFAFAPKTIMNIKDLDKTNLIQPGSRVEYNYLFTGPEEEISQIRSTLEKNKKPGDDIESLNEDDSSLGQTVDRSENFFLLGGLIAVLLSACTIGISSQRFARRHVSYVAILKTLGMNLLQIRGLYLLLFFYITLLTLVLGLTLGWFLQSNFISLMDSYFPTELPAPSLYPLYVTCVTVLICQFGFIYPHISKLLNISPMRVLKNDISFNQNILPIFFMGLMAFLLLLFIYTNQITLSLIIFSGVIIFSFTGIGFIYLLLGKSKLGLGAQDPVSLAFSELRRRKLSNSFQIFAFTVAIGLSLITFSASKNLLGSWQDSIPENSPNNFAININEEDKATMKRFLSENDIEINLFYPVANAQIVRKKDQDNIIDRNFNITWIKDLPEQNEIIDGEWFQEGVKNGISISDQISERYDLQKNDEVIIQMEDGSIETYIQSIRAVDWESFSPNFFVIGHPSLFEEKSSTHITSFFIPKSKQMVAAELMREFRTVSVFSIEELIKQVRDIVNQVTKALNSILLLTCLSALFLAFAALQDGFDQRRHQSAILRTLGATGNLVKTSSLIEFSILGLVSGLLGSAIAHTGVYFIEAKVFETLPGFYPEIWLMGPIIGILIVSGLSLYLVNGLMKQSPKDLLKLQT
jgi:putative ABC transport system permease protein